MFDPRTAIAGIAVMSGVSASLSASASASPAPVRDAPPAAGRYCAIQALPEALVRRGDVSPVACAETRAEAVDQLGDRAVSSFASASAFAAGNLLGVLYNGPHGPQDRPEPCSLGCDMVGDNCGWAINLAPWQDNLTSSAKVTGCSVMKLYNGPNFTEASTPVQGPGVLGLPAQFDNQISSVKFRA